MTHASKLAMSKDQPSVPRPVSDDDADDTALRHAIALSLQESGSTAELATGQVEEEMNTSSSQATFGYLSLNRRKMEEERLLRLANEKRQRPSSDAGDLAQMPPRKLKAPFGAEKSITTPSVPFPDGAVKRTWTRGYERTSDDITIEEVFRKDELLLAVLSSFQWDEKWMLSKLNIAKTKLLLIAFANDNGQVQSCESCRGRFARGPLGLMAALTTPGVRKRQCVAMCHNPSDSAFRLCMDWALCTPNYSF